jgi:hypothetical protein
VAPRPPLRDGPRPVDPAAAARGVLGLPEVRRVPHRPDSLGRQRGHHLRRAEGLHRGLGATTCRSAVGHAHGRMRAPWAGRGAALFRMSRSAARRDERHATAGT